MPKEKQDKRHKIEERALNCACSFDKYLYTLGVYDMSDRRDYNLDNTPQFISQSVFDSFVREMDISEVPIKYVLKIQVYHNNGSLIELGKNEIDHPLPINRNGNWDQLRRRYKNIKEIKVFVDIPKLERDINLIVDYFFDNIDTY